MEENVPTPPRRRRMQGIPELKVERAPSPAATAPVPSAPAGPAGVAPAEMTTAPAETTAAPAAPVASGGDAGAGLRWSLAEREDRRRLAGPSTVARRVAEAPVAAAPQASGGLGVPEAAVADAPAAQPVAGAVPQSGSGAGGARAGQVLLGLPVREDRRRLAGPANVPLLVAPPAQEAAPAAPAPSATDGAAPAVPAASGARPGSEVPAPTRMQTPTAAPAAAASAAPADAAASARAGGAEAVPEAAAPARAASEPMPVRAKALIGGAAAVVLAVVVVLLARWLRTTAGVEAFIEQYDGVSTHRAQTPVGLPWWLGWQHFLNMFFMVLIVRTGLQIRYERRPEGYWKPRKGSFFSPGSNEPKKVSITQWLHQSLDVLWVLNGIVFYVLIFATGHWMRIVPTSWDVFPNMVSGAIQYASLDWPAENGWIHYNALQVMAYFVTVFIAAPLAIVTGLRMSTWWPASNERLSKAFPVEAARAVHVPVMVYFLAFTAVHVFLVFFTGALKNLNHMYTARGDATDVWGLVVFAVSVGVIVAGWFLSRPMFTQPLAERTGTLTRN